MSQDKQLSDWPKSVEIAYIPALDRFTSTSPSEALRHDYRTVTYVPEHRVKELQDLLKRAIEKLEEAPLNQEPEAMAELFRRYTY